MSSTELSQPMKFALILCSFCGYFASRYVGNSLEVLCGSLLDHPFAKIITVFAIAFQASRDIKVSFIMSTLFILAQYVMTKSGKCAPYVSPQLEKQDVEIQQQLRDHMLEQQKVKLTPIRDYSREPLY